MIIKFYINVLDKAADASWTRNDVITNNISNADTPNYKRKDISFQGYLQAELAGTNTTTLNDRIKDVELSSLNATAYTDMANLSYRLDGNNVDIDTENVELASQICKDSLEPADILTKVGLENRFNNFPAQLSGGEQQRVAIARAIAKNPKLLLCDEPTGALDYKTGKQILQLLQDTCRKDNMTVIIITHNSAIASMADKVIHFKSGEVTNIENNSNPTPVEQIEW